MKKDQWSFFYLSNPVHQHPDPGKHHKYNTISQDLEKEDKQPKEHTSRIQIEVAHEQRLILLVLHF
jgi:hypothetical protein